MESKDPNKDRDPKTLFEDPVSCDNRKKDMHLDIDKDFNFKVSNWKSMVSDRVDSTKNFEEEYLNHSVLESEIRQTEVENKIDGTKQKFVPFWEKASSIEINNTTIQDLGCSTLNDALSQVEEEKSQVSAIVAKNSLFVGNNSNDEGMFLPGKCNIENTQEPTKTAKYVDIDNENRNATELNFIENHNPISTGIVENTFNHDAMLTIKYNNIKQEVLPLEQKEDGCTVEALGNGHISIDVDDQRGELINKFNANLNRPLNLEQKMSNINCDYICGKNTQKQNSAIEQVNIIQNPAGLTEKNYTHQKQGSLIEDTTVQHALTFADCGKFIVKNKDFTEDQRKELNNTIEPDAKQNFKQKFNKQNDPHTARGTSKDTVQVTSQSKKLPVILQSEELINSTNIHQKCNKSSHDFLSYQRQLTSQNSNVNDFGNTPSKKCNNAASSITFPPEVSLKTADCKKLSNSMTTATEIHHNAFLINQSIKADQPAIGKAKFNENNIQPHKKALTYDNESNSSSFSIKKIKYMNGTIPIDPATEVIENLESKIRLLNSQILNYKIKQNESDDAIKYLTLQLKLIKSEESDLDLEYLKLFANRGLAVIKEIREIEKPVDLVSEVYTLRLRNMALQNTIDKLESKNEKYSMVKIIEKNLTKKG